MTLTDKQVEAIIEAAGARQSAVRTAFEAEGYTGPSVQPEPVQKPKAKSKKKEYSDEE